MKLIKLTHDKHAVVDNLDFERLNKHKWYAVCKGKSKHLWYACRSVTVGYHWVGERKKFHQKKVYMHREIMELPDCFVDHKNNDGLDNRKSNLRKCTNSENMANQRKMKGVNRYKGVCGVCGGKFSARIKCKEKTGNKQIIVGIYDTEVEAALSYNEAAKFYFGDFAKLNEVSHAA